MSTMTGSHAYYRNAATRQRVKSQIDAYLGFFQPGESTKAARHGDYATMVNQYYDLATDFYERGWGKSFHFAPRHRDESFEASLVRHEHFLALQLGLRPGQKALDVGCGVGGPMRTIARFSGATIDGINNNEYQLKKLERYNAEAALSQLCRGFKGDFMAMDVPEATYDAAYEIEATCHAPDKVGVFREIHRVLKPGALFAGYEWCLTDRYDASNPRHAEIKHEIEVGDSLPDIETIPAVLSALEAAGFEILSHRDLAVAGDASIPWYQPLEGDRTSLRGLQRSIPGRFMSNRLVWLLERLGVAPQGSGEVSDMLNRGADALVAGGRSGIFTPCFFFLVRKRAS